MMGSTSRHYFFKGRVALFALLKAAGVGNGNRVLLPGFTCVVVPSAIRYLGAVPEYADIDSSSYNAHLPHYLAAYARLEREGKVSTLTALVIQHTYGNPARDAAEIAAWARSKGLIVIEDCAHCHGVFVGGREAGSFGDAAFFSFQWSKPVTTGLGGLAVLNESKYRARLEALELSAPLPSRRERIVLGLQLVAQYFLLRPRFYWFALRTHRRLSALGLFVGSSTIGELEGLMPVDYFKGMAPLQRRLAAKRLASAQSTNAHRKAIAAIYDALLAARGVKVFARETGAVPLRYPVRVRDRADCLLAAFDDRAELGDWFDHPLHPAGSNLEALNWRDDLCPTAAAVAADVVNLPLHEHISEREARRLVEFIAPWASRDADVS